MMEHTTEFIFNARYYTLGNFNTQINQIWFVLHGYGQLAKYFIRKFNPLTLHNIGVVAPEGLSRFYLEDVTRRARTGNTRVGATWMTAENRLVEIENYLRYLSAVHEEVMHNHPDVPVTVLGFSQGSATASRWAIHQPECCKRLILWSGIFPPDMKFDKAAEALATKELQMIYGLNDPYITDHRLAEMTSLSQRLGVHPGVITFEGGHEIDEKTLLRLV